MAPPKKINRPLLVIIGPTATGKTTLAISLAQKFPAVLISADSRQVYKKLDIATGKVQPGHKVKKGEGFWEVDGVPIYLFDVISFEKQFTVADFVKAAKGEIESAWQAGKLPIVIGGSGFYIEGLLRGFASLGTQPDWVLRKKLNKDGVELLQKKLQKISPGRFGRMKVSDRRNKRRLIRAIEVAVSAPSESVKPVKPSSVLYIGLTAPSDYLFGRIDEWVDKRIRLGMIEETKNLHRRGLTYKRMRELGLEYGYLAKLLRGEMAAEEFKIQLQRAEHDFARQQKKYLKKFKDTIWFDIEKFDFALKLFSLVAGWYNKI